MIDRDVKALLRGAYATADPLRWMALADHCEEQGDGKGARIWRLRAELYPHLAAMTAMESNGAVCALWRDRDGRPEIRQVWHPIAVQMGGRLLARMWRLKKTLKVGVGSDVPPSIKSNLWKAGATPAYYVPKILALVDRISRVEE